MCSGRWHHVQGGAGRVVVIPGDFDWDSIFESGVRWFHSGGIFAALSTTTSELIIEGMKAAKKAGAVTSFGERFAPPRTGLPMSSTKS